MTLDLEALRAAVAKMQPARWIWSKNRQCIDTAQRGTDGDYDAFSIGLDPEDLESWGGAWAATAAGIVALRNAADELLGEVEALRSRTAQQQLDLEASDIYVGQLEVKAEAALKRDGGVTGP